jgi:hypothetical protein
VERLGERVTPAHIEAFAGGAGGVAATAVAGGRTDAHVVGLGDQDAPLASDPPLANASLDNFTPPGFSTADALAFFTYTNSPGQKTLQLGGQASNGGDPTAPSARVDFGTVKFLQQSDLGNLMDFNVVADPGEVNGQAVDVTLDYEALLEGGTGGGTGHYEIRYSNETDGPFTKTAAAGDLPGSDPTAIGSVVLHTAIGKTFSVGIKGNAVVPQVNGTAAGAADVTVEVTMTLGPSGAVPGSGGSSPGTPTTPTTPTVPVTPTVTATPPAGLAPPGHAGGGKGRPTRPAAAGVGLARQALLYAQQKLSEFGDIPGADAVVNGQPNFDTNSWFYQRAAWIAHVQSARTPHALSQLLRQLAANGDLNDLQPSFSAQFQQFQRSVSKAKTAAEVAHLARQLDGSAQLVL